MIDNKDELDYKIESLEKEIKQYDEELYRIKNRIIQLKRKHYCSISNGDFYSTKK